MFRQAAMILVASVLVTMATEAGVATTATGKRSFRRGKGFFMKQRKFPLKPSVPTLTGATGEAAPIPTAESFTCSTKEPTMKEFSRAATAIRHCWLEYLYHFEAVIVFPEYVNKDNRCPKTDIAEKYERVRSNIDACQREIAGALNGLDKDRSGRPKKL